MAWKIAILPGDGIGPEVIAAGVAVLEDCARRHQLDLQIEEFAVGGRAIDEFENPLPDRAMQACQQSSAVLLGAVGGGQYDSYPAHLRPERALLRLRSELGLYANLRPVHSYDSLLDASPLKPEVVQGVDILIVRELTGGIYFGEPRGLETRSRGRVGFNSEVYFDYEIERIARVAFEAARHRNRKVTSVDKFNILESGQLWRTVVQEVSADYADIELEHILVDNAAMQLVARPRDFDVIVSSNMFGDILSDEAAMLGGSIGLLPSASLGESSAQGRLGLYEPVHGTAPDIAGQGKANPLAAIASVALLFRHSLERDDIGREVEAAIEKVLDRGLRTEDIAGGNGEVVGTQGMQHAILEVLNH